jgi:hypothetical protein
MQTDIDRLPKDTLKEILYTLNVRDVLNYCQHSKRVYNICDEDNFWKIIQYIIMI